MLSKAWCLVEVPSIPGSKSRSGLPRDDNFLVQKRSLHMIWLPPQSGVEIRISWKGVGKSVAVSAPQYYWPQQLSNNAGPSAATAGFKCAWVFSVRLEPGERLVMPTYGQCATIS